MGTGCPDGWGNLHSGIFLTREALSNTVISVPNGGLEQAVSGGREVPSSLNLSDAE